LRNGAHACGDYSVEKFLRGASVGARDLFARFVALIARCGPFETAPAKTRVAFLAKVRFASVNRIANRHIDVHFVLPRAVDSPRFRKVERVGNVFVHHLRLSEARDFDRQLASWLAQAYSEYGARRWLASRRAGRVDA
jgi:hypothetical protein